MNCNPISDQVNGYVVEDAHDARFVMTLDSDSTVNHLSPESMMLGKPPEHNKIIRK